MNSAELKRFDGRVRPGTKVLVEGLGWCVVKSIHPTRKSIQINGWVGSFQRGHVLKFSNTKKLVKEE
jgi:hypothetical protein